MVGDRVNPVTGQLRVNIHDDLATALFENQDVDPNQNGGVAVSDPVDVRSDKDLTLFLMTAKDFTLSLQYTDEDPVDENTNWYDLCDATGAAITFSCNNAKKAIPVSCKGIWMHAVLRNVDTAVDTPYLGVV